MKHTLFLCFISLLFQSLSAQITVTNASFPDVGDTLVTAIDGAPSGIEITMSGGDQQWDFSNLQGISREVVYQSPSEGISSAEFNNADMVVILGNNNGEAYYRSTDNSFELVGAFGSAPPPIEQQGIARYNPPSVERRSPMKFFDAGTTQTALLLPFSADLVPLAILDELPVTPDSIRLRISSLREDLVDAWGTLEIPGGSYEVLRERRIEYRETRLDVLVGLGPFASWQDVTDFIGLDEFLGVDTFKTYHFYSSSEKEAIAVVTVDPEDNTALSVEYKANDILSNVRYVDTGRSDILAYPNPAIDEVRFELMNLKSGQYKIKLFNILGVEVWSNSYQTVGDKTVKIDLTDLRKGTYLYSLIDNRGKTISTKRLMIIRP
ncbi:MAG: T9SS type A sorting domain-containing protein [Bacteroidota bacterium]